MKDFSKEITDKIKKEQIVPESKFKLNCKDYLFWGIFSCVLILGALFFSLIILNIANFETEIFHYLKFSKFVFLIFVGMPYLWILLLLGMIFFSFIIFRKTKRGYRPSFLFVAGIVVSSIFVLGVSAHFSQINNKLEKNIPGPEKIIRPMEGRWQRPEDGLLAGKIVQVEDKLFFLKTPRGEDWKIFYSEKTEFRRNVEIEKGAMVGVIGEKKDNHSFEAFVILSPSFKKMNNKGFNKGKTRCPFENCYNN